MLTLDHANRISLTAHIKINPGTGEGLRPTVGKILGTFWGTEQEEKTPTRA